MCACGQTAKKEKKERRKVRQFTVLSIDLHFGKNVIWKKTVTKKGLHESFNVQQKVCNIFTKC